MSARKSLIFSFLDRYVSLAITIVSSMVLARLLTPADIGVFSVTAVLLSFVSTVGGMGVGLYLVQEKDLTVDRIRAVWAIQLGLGIAMACLVLLASYPVALFYNEPRMRSILLVVSLNYAINPFGSLTYAWLIREMRFDNIAVMRFFSTLGGVLVSTWFAWQSYGPISLAFGSLTSTAVNALVAIYYRPKFFPWLPGLAEVRRVFIFGSTLTTSSIVRDFATNAPELLLGKFQNLSATGFYSRANGLVQMFNRLFVDAVSTVCLPWFAKQSRDQGGIENAYLKATAYVTALGWAFCLATICLAHPMIRVLYGPQWDQAVELTRLLAVAMIFGVPAALCSAALLSIGAANVIARVSVLGSIQSLIFAALGASQGLMALGITTIAAAAFGSFLWIRAVSKSIGLPLHLLLQTFRKSAAVALCSGLSPALALWLFGANPEHFVMPLAIGGAGGVAGFLAGVIFFRHPLNEEVLAIWARLRLMLV